MSPGMPGIRLGVAAIVAAAVAVAALAAQQTQTPAAPPQFRSGVDLVHLDVSVLDRNRRPVRGLVPADFTILENGKPQQLAVFKAVDLPDPEPPAAPWIRDVAPDVRTNDGVEERRLFLLILDDATMQGDSRAANNARDIGARVIDRLGPSDLAAVVFTRDNRNSQDYTADRAALRAAVEKVSVGFRDMGRSDELYFLYSVGVVESAINVLGTMPDRRKSIIYIGQGIPFDLGTLVPQLPGLPAGGGASALSAQGLTAQIQMQMERVFQGAARANVNVYTIDACGLRGVSTPIPPGPGFFAPRTCVPGLEVEYLRTLAENTGARAVVETNDFEPGVTAIFQENASYYLLGYQSTDQRRDGKIRRLEVVVNRPGVEVRTRNGYKAENLDKRRAEVAAVPLGAVVSGVLPKSDLPLQMSAVAVAVPGRREAAVAMTVGVRQPIRQVAGQTIEHVDLQVSAFNVEGKAFGSTRLRADVTLRAGTSGLGEYEVLSRLDLKPGRYQLRVAANVAGLSISGSLYDDIVVPDFQAAPLSVSGIVLSASPGPVVSPPDAFETILPVVPTTVRAFTPEHKGTAFARVYQGGKSPLAAVALRVQLRSEADVLVFDRREDLSPTRFTAARSTDIRVELPFARLSPGEYLLTVEASLGKTIVRRDSRFHVGQ